MRSGIAGICRGGSIDPPAFRPGSNPRQSSRSKIRSGQSQGEEKANRDTKRLETALNPRKHALHTHSNRDKNTCFSTSRFSLPPNARDRNDPRPFIFVSVRKISVVCFLQLTENLNEPLFRIDVHSEANKNRKEEPISRPPD